MSGLAALLGGLGLVAVAFGLLSALVAIFQPVTDLSWLVGNLAIGVVLLSASLFVGFDSVREHLRSGGTRRAGKYGGSAILSTLLGIILLGMLGFLADRHPLRLDWSEDRINTLTEQSLDLLSRIEGDVRLRAFFLESEMPAASDLLDRYAYASDRVTLEFIDPNSVPMLVEDLELDPEALARGLARVEIGDAAVVVTEFEESEVTNALLKLTRSGGKRVYFLDGHNERLIANQAGEAAEAKESAGRAADALRNETYGVESLNLASRGDVPEDADVLVVAGPTRVLFEHELDALRRYMDGGGSLLLLIDPRAQTNLYDLLGEWGVALGDDVVVDQSLALFGQATSPFAAGYSPDHPITAEMRETTLFPMVRSVAARADSESRYEAIVLSGEDSWAERDLDGWRRTGRAVFDERDLTGPVPIALAGSPNSSAGDDEARLVVVGDSDFASNEFIESFRNRDLFLNAVNWLMGDIEQISLRPRLARASRFRLDGAQFRRIQYLSLFVLPEAIAVLGVFTWWLRRESGRR